MSALLVQTAVFVSAWYPDPCIPQNQQQYLPSKLLLWAKIYARHWKPQSSTSKGGARWQGGRPQLSTSLDDQTDWLCDHLAAADTSPNSKFIRTPHQ